MSNNNIVALVFLVLGLLFMISLFRSLFKIISMQKSEETFTGLAVLKTFLIPILSFLALMYFIIAILPGLQ
jgi:hypothetical protein